MLFAIGSACFLVGPFPGFVQAVGAPADGIVFFVGSIFFTAAAFLQYLEAAGAGRIDRLSSLIQLGGTLFFNLSTFHALQSGLDSGQVDRLVWAPDALGSVCFLVSGILAYLEVRGGFSLRGESSIEWRIGAVNLLGCFLFGVSAIASFIVPKTGSIVDLGAANWTTSAGALCFGVGALLLLREGRGGTVKSREPAVSSGRSPQP